jgi:hypothetical protein
VPPQAVGGQHASYSATSSSSESQQVNQNISNPGYWQHFSTSTASSTLPAEFRKIEKVNFLKYLSHEFETATGQSKDDVCEASSTYLESIAYGDLTGDKAEEAVVRLVTCLDGAGGGSSRVYALDDKGSILEITPDLSKYSFYKDLFKNYQGHGYFDIDKSGELIYSFPVYNEGDSDSSPTGGGITIFLKRDGKQFIFDKSVIDPAAYNNQQTINQSSTPAVADYSTSTSIISPSTPDTQWLTFSDKKLGFSIDYPKGVDVMPDGQRINFGDASNQYPWYSGVNVHQENESIDQFFQIASEQVSLPDKLAIDSLLMIDNEPAMVFHESGSEADINRTAIVSHDNKLFEIDINSYYDTTTKTILNSFRFLK